MQTFRLYRPGADGRLEPLDKAILQPIVKTGPRGGKIVGYEHGDITRPIYQHEVAGPGMHQQRAEAPGGGRAAAPPKPAAAPAATPAPKPKEPEATAPAAPKPPEPAGWMGKRDPRLPKPGTVLKTSFKGQDYTCVEGDDGLFTLKRGDEDLGKFKSLSAAGAAVEGHASNGFARFGLGAEKERLIKAKEEAKKPFVPKAAAKVSKINRTVDPDKIIMDVSFQPRTFTDKNGVQQAFDQKTVDEMRTAGQLRGEESGWDEASTNVVKVWCPPGEDPATTDKLYVFEGFHRTALAQQTGHRDLNVEVYSGISKEDAMTLGAESNTKTKAMHPLDEARLFRQEFDRGLTAAQIGAKHGGRTAGYVEKRALLDYLHPDLKDALRDRKITADYAEAIGYAAKMGGSPALQRELAKEAMSTKTRADMFHNFVRAVVARLQYDPGKLQQDDFGDLFGGEGKDNWLAAMREQLTDQDKKSKLRDGWTKLHTTLTASIKAMQDAGVEVPPEYQALLDKHMEVGQREGWALGVGKKRELKELQRREQAQAQAGDVAEGLLEKAILEGATLDDLMALVATFNEGDDHE